MASDYYLLKTEPTGYSFADLQRDSVTEWDGVSNPVALRNLREMKPGTKLVIYETGDIKSAVGTASVVKSKQRRSQKSGCYSESRQSFEDSRFACRDESRFAF